MKTKHTLALVQVHAWIVRWLTRQFTVRFGSGKLKIEKESEQMSTFVSSVSACLTAAFCFCFQCNRCSPNVQSWSSIERQKSDSSSSSNGQSGTASESSSNSGGQLPLTQAVCLCVCDADDAQLKCEDEWMEIKVNERENERDNFQLSNFSSPFSPQISRSMHRIMSEQSGDTSRKSSASSRRGGLFQQQMKVKRIQTGGRLRGNVCREKCSLIIQLNWRWAAAE